MYERIKTYMNKHDARKASNRHNKRILQSYRPSILNSISLKRLRQLLLSIRMRVPVEISQGRNVYKICCFVCFMKLKANSVNNCNITIQGNQWNTLLCGAVNAFLLRFVQFIFVFVGRSGTLQRKMHEIAFFKT